MDKHRVSDVKYAVHWVDRGREPQVAPNPAYPDGMDPDVSLGAPRTCRMPLPYPAPRCGLWEIVCEDCGLMVAVTAAGRPDDPRSVRLPCKELGATGTFPEGRISESDEGDLTLAVSRDDKNGVVIIDFGKSVSWIGLPPDRAAAFAEAIRRYAERST